MTVVMTIGQLERPSPRNVISSESTHSYARLINRTATIVRCINVWNKRATTRQQASTRAEVLWLRDAQWQTFRTEIRKLENDPTEYANYDNLRLILDDQGLLRVKSRLVEGDATDPFKHPILLSDKIKLTEMIIQNIHQNHHHAGAATTTTILRQRFWVLRSRKTVRETIKKCTICLRWNQQPVKQPIANLPPFRINWSAPFVHVGVDFAGPVMVSSRNSTDEPLKHKFYIVLFTCAVSRAVHLEAAASLESDEFLLAFRRFVSRRGLPTCVYSDNATTFQRASRILIQARQLPGCPQVLRYLKQRNIEWKFIVERAPWWGGFWERMVKSVKEPLRKALGWTTIDATGFATILTEIEAVVNSRPLAIMYDAPDDPRPITLAMILLGRPLQSIDVDGELTLNGPRSLQEVYQSRHKFRSLVQQCWVKEYIGFLRSAHRENTHTNPFPIQINQVVLMSSPQQKRVLWPLVRIVRVFPGRDGIVRACEVVNSEGKRFRRPVDLLIPLEEVPNSIEVDNGPTGGMSNVEIHPIDSPLDQPRMVGPSGGQHGDKPRMATDDSRAIGPEVKAINNDSVITRGKQDTDSANQMTPRSIHQMTTRSKQNK